MNLDLVWNIADTLNGLMAIPNLIAVIALSGVVILVVHDNEGFEYAGYLIYVMAMYAFYNVITAVTDLVKYRKFRSPVMSASKAIKLAAALVSMLSLECTTSLFFQPLPCCPASSRRLFGRSTA